MPGYGRSANGAGGAEPLSFASIAGAIEALLDDLGLERAHLVGLSFGGQQALHFAISNPGRVDRLVLADTSASFGADGTDPDEWMRLRLDPLDRGLTPADIAEPIIDAISGPDFAGPLRDLAIESFSRISGDGLRSAVRCLPNHDVESQLGLIEAETLVIVGEYDEETPPTYSETLVRGIADARLEVLPGVGHLTPCESPELFNQLVAEFLDPDS